MGKYIGFIFMLSWACIAFGQVDKSHVNRIWISIDFEDISSDFNDGFNDHYTRLIKFENDSVIIMHFGKDDDMPVPFTINQQNYILSEKFENARIFKLTSDSLIIDFDTFFRYTFIPIPLIRTLNEHKSLKEFLPMYEWTLKTNDGKEKTTLDFLNYNDNKAMTRPGYEVLSLDYLYADSSSFYHKDGFWTIKVINETTLLHYQFVFDSYAHATLLISEISEDSISGISWYQGKQYKMTLYPEDNLTAEQKEELEDCLISGKWQLESYEIPTQLLAVTGGFSDGNEVDMELRIDSMDFVRKRIAYKFNSDYTYKKYKGNRVAFDGRWKLSRTGNVLKLEEYELAEGFSPLMEKYVKIDRLERGELKVLSLEELFINEFQTNNYYIKQAFIRK